LNPVTLPQIPANEDEIGFDSALISLSQMSMQSMQSHAMRQGRHLPGIGLDIDVFRILRFGIATAAQS